MEHRGYPEIASGTGIMEFSFGAYITKKVYIFSLICTEKDDQYDPST